MALWFFHRPSRALRATIEYTRDPLNRPSRGEKLARSSRALLPIHTLPCPPHAHRRRRRRGRSLDHGRMAQRERGATQTAAADSAKPRQRTAQEGPRQARRQGRSQGRRGRGQNYQEVNRDPPPLPCDRAFPSAALIISITSRTGGCCKVPACEESPTFPRDRGLELEEILDPQGISQSAKVLGGIDASR